MGLLKIFVLLALIPLHATAQESTLQREGFFKTLGKDFISPATTDAKYILIGGTIATTAVALNRRNRSYRQTKSFEDAKPLRNFGFIGDLIGYGFLNGTYTLGMWYYGATYDNKKALKDAEVMARASTITLAWTTALKSVIQEKRPGFPDDQNSFPSGHAAGAFSFAGVVAARHGWGWGFVAHAVAGFIAVSRNNDDFHYLHDLMAGATIGAAYAWGVSERAMNNENYLFALLPTGRDGVMATIGASF